MHPIIRSKGNYLIRVKALFGSSLIGYWPLNEASGSTALDRSPQLNHGTYVSCDLANANGPAFTHTKCPTFDGINSKVNIYSAGLAADFDGAEGAMGFWMKVSEVGDWGQDLYSAFGFQADLNNRVFLRTYDGAAHGDSGFSIYYNAGGDSDSVIPSKLESFSDWLEVWVSWSYSAGQLNVYINGVLCDYKKAATPFPLTLTGEWAGALEATGAVLGSFSSPWRGNLAHFRLLNRPVTAAEVRALYPYGVILFDGDSRTNLKPYPFEAFGHSSKTTYGFKHLGTSGAGFDELITAAPANVDPWLHGPSNICVIWTGVNNSSWTAQVIHDHLEEYCLARKAAGWKVIACTEIDAQDAGRLANGWPTKYLDLNTLIRADYSTFADGLADLGGNANLQDATNTTYFSADKVHLTDAGYSVVADIVGASLTSL